MNHRRTAIGHLARVVIGLALAASLLIWGFPTFAKASWSQIFAGLATVPPLHAVGFGFLVVLGLASYTLTFTGSLPGLAHWRAFIVNLCGSSVSKLLPGGGAIGLAATYTILRSWGFSNREVSTSVILTGVWNTLSRIALPVVAIVMLWWGDDGVPKALLQAASAAAVAGFAIIAFVVTVIASDRVAHTVGRSLDRLLAPLFKRRQRTMSVDALIRDMRARINGVVRTGWLRMTLGMVGFMGFYYLLFLLIMKTFEISLPLGILFAAFAIGRVLTAVGITPGGVGITESATVLVLVDWGADSASAAAGVVLFSMFTHLLEIPLGALGWIVWSLSPKKKLPPGN